MRGARTTRSMWNCLALAADEDLDLKPGKGKTIRSNYVHIVGVRRMWCEHGGRGRGAAVPAADIPKLDWKAATRKPILRGLEASNKAMLALFHRKAASSKGRWTLGLFAYCIAHEAHHRSQSKSPFASTGASRTTVSSTASGSGTRKCEVRGCRFLLHIMPLDRGIAAGSPDFRLRRVSRGHVSSKIN